jgi:sodium transport system ATP-binding protein
LAVALQPPLLLSRLAAEYSECASMIEVQHLHKQFKQFVAVEDVSFTAADGQITGLLGPNGAGKTTVLRILYTVYTPDRGTARIDGFDIQQEPQAVRRRIGVLPDSGGLYSRLTTREHIRYFGRLHGLQPPALERAIDHLVDLLELHDIADRRTEGFSHGQRLKVGLARALVHNPRNLLLDEPTNGLDVMSTRTVRRLLRRLRDDGHCLLFSSHVMQEVSALCDQIVVLARGQVAAAGTADQLRAATGQPNLEDAFVAAIGSEEGLML